MKKIAVVVQRYGPEVNGGAENHARQVAMRLAPTYNIEIITTTALDYQTWKNHYPEGEQSLDGILVHRFPTKKFEKRKYKKYRKKVLMREIKHKILKKIGLFDFLNKRYSLFEPTEQQADLWLIHQGPYSPELLTYIKKNKSTYDCFIFFTYLYYPTVTGMREVGEKSIFVPTAHDEAMLYSRPYKGLFSLPKFIMYNTKAEKELIENHFSNVSTYHDIAGLALNEPLLIPDNENMGAFNFDYFLYMGRIDAGKGCVELVRWFEKFSRTNSSVKLVLIGKNSICLTSNHPNVIFPGFVDEKTKIQILNSCKALIIPSRYESQSMVTIEAMAYGKIVIANERCKVLKDHIDQSHSGFYYSNYDRFAEILNTVLKMSPAEYDHHAVAGKRYALENYTWDKVLAKFQKAISIVINSNDNSEK